MSIFSNLNPDYGQSIHRKMFNSVVNQSNNLLTSTSRKILRISKKETPSRHDDKKLDGTTWKEDLNLLANPVFWSIIAQCYIKKTSCMSEEETPSRHDDKKLDGITWKEDLNLLATSAVWSIVPLIINIVTLPFEIAVTLLSSVVPYLITIGTFLTSFYKSVRHDSRNTGIPKKSINIPKRFMGILRVVETIMQPLIYLLSLSCIIIRSIPFVGHALRMGYKLIDGQYKINPVESLGAQQPRFSPASADSHLNCCQSSFSMPQSMPQSEANRSKNPEANAASHGTQPD